MSQIERGADLPGRSRGRAEDRTSSGARGRSSARAVVQRLRWDLRTRLAQHRSYLFVARLRHGLEMASDETELLIDGFPRSGNTFAVVAFQLAQPAPVRISHHIHSSAHMIAAVKRGTPVVVTVREPREAVLSCVIREPYVTIGQALRAYAAFYRRLHPWRDRMVVAEFREVIADFGGVVRRVNERFGTVFTPFAHTPESVAECFGIIEDRARRPAWDESIGAFLAGTARVDAMREAAWRHQAQGGQPLPIPEDRVARPSPHREARKRALRAAYSDPRIADLRTEATEVYQRFTAPL